MYHLLGCSMKEEIQDVFCSVAVLGSRWEKLRTGKKGVEFTEAKQTPQEALFEHWKAISAFGQNR